MTDLVLIILANRGATCYFFLKKTLEINGGWKSSGTKIASNKQIKLNKKNQ